MLTAFGRSGHHVGGGNRPRERDQRRSPWRSPGSTAANGSPTTPAPRHGGEPGSQDVTTPNHTW